MKLIAFVTAAVAILSAARAHISITFPPARQPNYDFLDNVRTGGPCGVPEDADGAATTFRAGSTINITFHLAYPHRGGILVNIVNSNGSISYPLLGTQWVNVNDSTRLHQEVTLPQGFTCDRCVLQLLRQAGEWSAPGGGYLFWSCADISIVDSPDAVCNAGTCSGHGTCNNGNCVCDRLYSGEFCQNKDECLTDADCGNRGSCIDTKATTFPRRQCFCNPGWIGEGCSRQSSISDARIDPSQYTITRRLHDRLLLHARIVGDEIEVAMVHNGTGYVALGWRPSKGIDGSCRAQAPGRYPIGSHLLWPDEQTIPMLDQDTNILTVINLPLFDLGGGAEEGGAEEGGAEEGGAEEGGAEEGGAEEGGAGPTEEGGVEEGGAEDGGAEEGGADEEGRAEHGGAEEGGAEEGGADEEGRPQDGGAEEGGAEGGPTEEGGAEEGGAEEGPAEEGAPEGRRPVARLHPMDCTDIVIGVARGNQFRVFDFYTRDRSTPRMDEFYGGQDSITGAIAKEESGITYVKWRKPLRTADSADHSIRDQQMSVIWSFGQVFPDYFHNPGSGIEAGTAQNTRFYQPDEIKYHGARNRGSTSINFFDVDSNTNDICRGEFSTGCDAQGQSCDYRATWEVKGFNVEYTVTARQVENGRTEWVAIGFSDNRMMPDSDAVVGAADSTGFFVTDRYIEAYAPPPIDNNQNIFNVMATFENGFTTMSFSRPITTEDPRDLSLSQCRYFLYGWGGPATIATRDIMYHPSTPIISTDRICLPTPLQCGVSGANRLATPLTFLSLCTVLLMAMLFFT